MNKIIIYNKNIDMNQVWNSYLEIANKSESDGKGNDHSDFKITSDKINNIMKFFPIDKYPNVLTLGCGDGGETKVFLDNGYNAIGITLGKDNIKMAKDLYNIDLIETDMNVLTFNPESFNLIYMNHSFEHIFSPFITCLELWRILKDDGRCLITVPSPDNQNAYNGLWHYNLLYENQIINIFEMCGFKKIENYKEKKPESDDVQFTFIFEKLSTFMISKWSYLSYIHKTRNKCSCYYNDEDNNKIVKNSLNITKEKLEYILKHKTFK